MLSMQRVDGRLPNQFRSISVEPNYMPNAHGSVLIKCGDTHVICSATLEENIPPWLKGQGRGWVTAEYNMLPTATGTRTRREREKLGGRTVEIQRLISRALRASVDLKKMPDCSFMVDCDVIRADGGTRTTSITGGYIALALAVKNLLGKSRLVQNPIVDSVAAISCGIVQGVPVTDLNYPEDSTAEVDMNFVVTGNGSFVEVQGTAENGVFAWSDLEAMKNLALQACGELKAIQSRFVSF